MNREITEAKTDEVTMKAEIGNCNGCEAEIGTYETVVLGRKYCVSCREDAMKEMRKWA